MSISRHEVLKVYAASKDRNTAVGIRLKGRDSLLITDIIEISDPSSTEMNIILSKRSIYGEDIRRTRLQLTDMESIVNLRISYHDPFYVYLRELRSSIRSIREEVGIEKSI